MRRRVTGSRARLYQSLRSAHLERARTLAPAAILYRNRRYDFDESLAEGMQVVRAGALTSALLLLGSPVRVLEVNEPLMRSAVRRTAFVVAALRIGALGRRRIRIVTYAIENTDPFALPALSPRARIARWLDERLSRFIWGQIDRVAFGTAASQQLYAQTRPRSRPEQLLIDALPAPRLDVDEQPRAPVVVFLGAFAERKGLPLVITSWPEIHARVPAAQLVLIGKGPLEHLATHAGGAAEGIEVMIDPGRRAIRRVLGAAKVLVLPSQPVSGWREQVGLPIVEGLESGCRIVTTSETGIAEWLAAHGHSVIAPGDNPTSLVDAVVTQLERRESPREVLATLPARDGRLAADDWLMHETLG